MQCSLDLRSSAKHIQRVLTVLCFFLSELAHTFHYSAAGTSTQALVGWAGLRCKYRKCMPFGPPVGRSHRWSSIVLIGRWERSRAQAQVLS